MAIQNNKIMLFLERIDGTMAPITADVFLTNFCNNKCTYCRYNESRNNSYMKFDDFKRYTERLLGLGVRAIILTGGGEPTVSPDFDKITRYLEENNIPYGVNTNFNVLKEIKPVFLKVSIDEGNPEKYKRTRGVYALDKVCDNITRFASFNESNGHPTRIGVQCVTYDIIQTREFYERVKDLPVDYIQFRPIEQKGENIDYKEILQYVDSLNDDKISKSYKYDLVNYTPPACIGNWAAISMNEKGEVLLCCHRHDEIIGHIMDEDILDKRKKPVTNMAMCERPCRLSGVNETLVKLNLASDRYFV